MAPRSRRQVGQIVQRLGREVTDLLVHSGEVLEKKGRVKRGETDIMLDLRKLLQDLAASLSKNP